MNKLVSKNPVQRFKQGRKIVKAQFGYKTRNDGVIVNQTGIPVGTVNGGYIPRSTTQDIDYQNEYLSDKSIVPGLYLDTYDNSVWASRPKEYSGQTATRISNGPEVPANGTYYETTDESGKVIDKGRYFGGVRHSLPIGKTSNNKSDQEKPSINEDKSKKIPNKKSVTSSFKDAFNKARAKNLQEFIWNGKRYNTMKAGETKEQWLANIKAPQDAQKVDLSQITKPLVPVIAPKIDAPIIPKVSSRGGNFNKSQIRDLIKNGGFNPYNYTGAQRRALRMYLNGESNDTSLLDGTDLARFTIPYRKNGGILPSRNIVERFKSKINKN